MTIEFKCPHCGALIAFPDKDAGKRAKCLSCQEKFVIPSADFEKAQKIKPPPEKTEPIPGFYRAVFAGTWGVFVHKDSVTSLVFVIAVVCFKFFLAQTCCCNYVAPVVIWGWLLGFYLNLIFETAVDRDPLPEIYLGTSITFIWDILKPFLIFLYTMFIVQLPLILAVGLLRNKGVTLTNIWTQGTWPHRIVQGLFVFGLFLFPSAILGTAVGKDLTFLRPDCLLKPIFKAFGAYIVTVILLVAAGILQMHTVQFTGASVWVTAGHLAVNLAAQVLAIFAMRSIGLFCRHYGCYLKW